MKKYLYLFFALFALQFRATAQAPNGGAGECHFVSEAAMNAFSPSNADPDQCRLAFCEAEKTTFRWDGTVWVRISETLCFDYRLTGVTGGTLTLPRAVPSGAAFELHRNGVLQDSPVQYTVSGTTVTLVAASVSTDIWRAAWCEANGGMAAPFSTVNTTAPITGNGSVGSPVGFISGATTGHVLTWDGSTWVSQAPASGAADGNGIYTASGTVAANAVATVSSSTFTIGDPNSVALSERTATTWNTATNTHVTNTVNGDYGVTDETLAAWAGLEIRAQTAQGTAKLGGALGASVEVGVAPSSFLWEWKPSGYMSLPQVSTTLSGAEPNGSMYYDNTLAKFRCKQGGVWQDCISTGPLHTVTTYTTATHTCGTVIPVTIPVGVKEVEVEAIGGGGGGASGSINNSVAHAGGGGGAGGGYSFNNYSIPSTGAPTSVDVNFGCAGTGGTSVSGTVATAGNTGADGGDSWARIGGSTVFIVNAAGGTGGTAPSATGTNNGGASPTSSDTPGGAGGNGTTAGNATGGAAGKAGSGGGGGGFMTGGNVAGAGAAGSSAYYRKNNGGTASGIGAAGNSGVAPTNLLVETAGGSGGGGSGGTATSSGLAGGNGAQGSGGGGGGAGPAVAGFSSGAGGNGGAGMVRLTFKY